MSRFAHLFLIEEPMSGTSEDGWEIGRLRTGTTGRKSKNRKWQRRDGSHGEILRLLSDGNRIVIECRLGSRPDLIG